MTKTLVRPLLCLLLLAAASVACAQTALPDNAVQATERANETASSFGGANEPQATPEIILMGENQAQTILEPVVVSTTDPALIAALQEAADANQRARDALQQINDQNERISQNAKEAAAANERSTVLELTRAVILNSTAQEKTAERALAVDERTAQTDADKAAAEMARANAQNILSLCVLAITVSMVLLAVRALARHPVKERAAVVVGSGDYFTRPWVPTAPTSHTTKALPASDDDVRMFLEYAVTGLPLGENSMVKAGAWKSGQMWREKRQLIMTYLDTDCRHIKDHKMTPEGMDYWRDWLDEHEAPRPAPDPEAAETTTSEGHEHVNNDHVDPTEEVVDTQPDQFLPSGPTYHAGIEPRKDDE